MTKAFESRLTMLERTTSAAWGLVVVNNGEPIEDAIKRSGAHSPRGLVFIPAKDATTCDQSEKV